MHDIRSLNRGSANLLQTCAGLTASDSLLIVNEDAALGWYQAELAATIATAARELGITTDVISVGAPRNERNRQVEQAMRQYDCTLFLSRIGDQDRFATASPGKKIVMCYLRDLDMLGSSFATASHAAVLSIKKTLDRLINRTRLIEIQCPLGSDFRIEQRPQDQAESSDVSVVRFPLGVVAPVSADNLSGKIVLANYLTPTGSRVYEPANLKLTQPISVEIESGRILGFDGDPTVVDSVERHYREVSSQFDIDPSVVHSWHIGLHPGLDYRQAAATDPDRWSNTVFNHPRILHLHTCGDYAPGEICWMIKDPSLELDGITLWENGVLQYQAFDELTECIQRWPELNRLYSAPAGQIGL